MQARAGVRERAEQLGRRMIRSTMPDQHRQFFEQLPFLLLGSVDPHGDVWATPLVGRPGFVYSPDERTLRVRAQLEEPATLSAGSALGVLGIELPTRRRNRVNGHVQSVDAHGFTLAVDQSFGNCNMYINARTPQPVVRERGEPTRVAAQLGDELAAWIRQSDTAFIASASSACPHGTPSEGVDVSHRGGVAGFVKVEQRAGKSVLTMPDYAGNNAFNTLGNVESYPRVGLSFPNFERGDWLALTGSAELVWDADEVARFPRAQRLLRITVARGLVLPGRLPFAWTQPVLAPQLA